MKRITALFILFAFLFNTVMPTAAMAQALNLPEPGAMVALSAPFTPAHLKGMVIDPNNPFKFDFIIYRGDEPLTDDLKQPTYTKLIKYFLAALAVPDTDQWVNLSPYEENRIIPDGFGFTEMGRDLLSQDYILKQLAASLTAPDNDMGKQFWDRVYEAAHEKFGTTEVPTDIINKVWIIPDKAVVYEKGNTVYVVSNHLKVMMEKDYLAMQKRGAGNTEQAETSPASELTQGIMREVIIPAIEKEVNEGKNFVQLRQVYSGMLLATWYKRALKESILGKLYADQGKVKGIDQDPKNNQEIYNQYVEAFKKGVFNMIKEDVDRYTQEMIPRKYFSGGLTGTKNTVFERNDAQASRDFTQSSPNLEAVETDLVNPAMVTPREDLENRQKIQGLGKDIWEKESAGDALKPYFSSLPSGYFYRPVPKEKVVTELTSIMTNGNRDIYLSKQGMWTKVEKVIKAVGPNAILHIVTIGDQNYPVLVTDAAMKEVGRREEVGREVIPLGPSERGVPVMSERAEAIGREVVPLRPAVMNKEALVERMKGNTVSDGRDKKYNVSGGIGQLEGEWTEKVWLQLQDLTVREGGLFKPVVSFIFDPAGKDSQVSGMSITDFNGKVPKEALLALMEMLLGQLPVGTLITVPGITSSELSPVSFRELLGLDRPGATASLENGKRIGFDRGGLVDRGTFVILPDAAMISDRRGFLKEVALGVAGAAALSFGLRQWFTEQASKEAQALVSVREELKIKADLIRGAQEGKADDIAALYEAYQPRFYAVYGELKDRYGELADHPDQLRQQIQEKRVVLPDSLKKNLELKNTLRDFLRTVSTDQLLKRLNKDAFENGGNGLPYIERNQNPQTVRETTREYQRRMWEALQGLADLYNPDAMRNRELFNNWFAGRENNKVNIQVEIFDNPKPGGAVAVIHNSLYGSKEVMGGDWAQSAAPDAAMLNRDLVTLPLDRWLAVKGMTLDKYKRAMLEEWSYQYSVIPPGTGIHTKKGIQNVINALGGFGSRSLYDYEAWLKEKSNKGDGAAMIAGGLLQKAIDSGAGATSPGENAGIFEDALRDTVVGFQELLDSYRIDAAMADNAEAVAHTGGIDFNAASLDMQIKRDGNGVPLPVSQQNLDNIKIDGLVPVILNIRPAAGLPLFSELAAPSGGASV
jgi:hypothetical protein